MGTAAESANKDPKAPLTEVDPDLVEQFGDEAQYVLTEEQLNDYRDQQLEGEQWRDDSAIERDYYHGNQLDPALIEKWRQRGIPIMVVNRMRKSINGVVGIQESNMTDGIVRAETGAETEELGEALSAELKTAERETGTDGACLDAFAGMCQGGIDWVEVSTESDPFKFHTAVQVVPWREMWWDRRAVKPDFSDARFLRRVRFLDRQALARRFKKHAEIIMSAGGSTMDWFEPMQYQRGQDTVRSSPRWSDYWYDRRGEVCIEEVWYKVEVEGYVVTLKTGVTSEWDPRNPQHLAAWRAGLVEPRAALFKKTRQAYWLGPHRLIDRWSPLPHNEYPYVPFVCYTEDSTGDPYGLGRDLRYLQDEINVRRAKMGWAMDATRTYVEEDAVENHAITADEIGRKDAYIRTKTGAVAGGKIKVDQHQGISAQQFEVYKDAEATIQDVAGTPDPFLGEQDSAGQSGRAMQTRIAQTMTSLGKVNRNFRQSRQKVLQLLLAHVVAKMGQGQEIKYEDRTDGTKRSVVVNKPEQDAAGYGYITNNLQQMRLKLVLDEIPSTPTFRMQQFESILRALTGAPEPVQRVLWPSALELSEVPNRKQAVKALKKELGLSEPETPEEQKAAEEQAAEAKRARKAQLRGLEAKAVKDEATAQSIAAKTQPEVALLAARVDELLTRIAQMEQDLRHQEVALAANPNPKTEAVLRW